MIDFIFNTIKTFVMDLELQNALTKMKNSLLQSYRYYCSTTKNPMHAWTELEKEVFDNLFDDYEKLGGDGFMHSVVQPEIEKLDVIPMSDVEQIQLLYSSRKN